MDAAPRIRRLFSLGQKPQRAGCQDSSENLNFTRGSPMKDSAALFGSATPILRSDRRVATWSRTCPEFSPRFTFDCKPSSVTASQTSAASPVDCSISSLHSTSQVSGIKLVALAFNAIVFLSWDAIGPGFLFPKLLNTPSLRLISIPRGK